MNKNILVTGAAGFVGSFICEELVTHGYRVWGVDNFFRGTLKNLNTIFSKENFSFIELDLSLENSIVILKQLIIKNNIHIVLHFAAINGTAYFYERSLFVFDQNIKITQNLLLAVTDTAIQYLIYASSSEVYGDAQQIPTPESEPILLNIFSERDSYAASKVIGDYYVKFYAEKNHLPYLILRIFNLYGERMVTSHYGQVVPEFIHQLLLKKEFTILGNGKQTRSFCYIKDAVSAIRMLMEKQITGVLNLGHDEEITILALAQKLHEINHEDFHPVFLPARPHDHHRRCPDITRLKAHLPTLIFTPLAVGLAAVMHFYQQLQSDIYDK